jgi:plasmid stabilization system protein ParE
MKRIILSARARLDLLTIWQYIAQDSMDAADRVILEIRAEFQKLAEMPGMGHRRAEIRDERYRVWSVHSYLIVYRPDTSPLNVVRIVSGYRDLKRLFK